jgi:cell wall-associated NlpC family hydrolase
VSLAEVASRIAAIQSQALALSGALPANRASTSTSTTSAEFASALGAELGSSSLSGLDLSDLSSLSSLSGLSTGSRVPATSGGGGGSPGSPDGDDIAAWASKYVGVPYVAGGRGTQGWDCAGFTQWTYKQFGVKIPEVSWLQVKQGTAVDSLKEAKPGDLLFFHVPGGHSHDPSPLGVNHVGIYLGGGRMVEAANPSAGTRIGKVDTDNLVRIRRVVEPGDGVALTPKQVRAAATGATTPAAAVAPTTALASTTSVGADGRLGPRQLVDVLRRAGFSGEGLRTAWALAMRESSGRPGALSKVNSNGTRDHGLFQLNSIHVGRVIDADKVFDADANARAAFKLSHHGKNFSAWGIGHTGWAGHLERMQPATYAAYNARFQELLARFPD